MHEIRQHDSVGGMGTGVLVYCVLLCLSACGGDLAPEQSENISPPLPCGDTQGLARRFHTVEGGSEFSPSDGELVTVRPRDTIPAILEPVFAPVKEASKWMEPDELVLGIEIDGDARAYPIKILSWREVVNDVVAGMPIAATW